MSQELIFTVLPHQRIVRDGQNYLQLSVYVTIRLESVSNGKLSDFEDILNWPDKIIGNKYVFEFNGSALAYPGELQKTKIDKDGYTYRTADGKRSAHFEHTIVITEDKPEILTVI